MTWTFGEPVEAKGGDTKALRATKGESQGDYAGKESAAAVKAAAAAAADLIESGVLGEGDFVVHATGHSNPGGEPEPGWSSDTLSIHVSRVMPPVERPAEVVVDAQDAEPVKG